MKQKIKDVADGRWNWYGLANEEESQDNCYKGLFWDLETRSFLRWNELRKEGKSTERKSTE
ncbi:hypothetical protein N9S40_00090 [Candidatus Pelagibacter sp.]|nr:hypothetical protein [Candidatus Pelagibacter sp.]